MASRAANDLDVPAIAGEIVLLDPHSIDIHETERLRPIDEAWAQAIGASMKRDGQINAVSVQPKPEGGWTLAGPGGHRTVGARKLGIPIEAKIVGGDADSQRRREAAENLFRRSNDPVERATAIAELVRLHKLRSGIDPSKDGRAASVQARWQKRLGEEAADTNDTMSLVYGWSDDVAEQIGVSKRTVERDLLLYRRIAPSLVARLRGARHPIAANAAQLRALAKLEADQQERVVQTLLYGDDDQGRGTKSVSDALARLSGANRTASDPETKRLSAFIGSFQRMGLPEKKGALAELLPLLPAGTILSNMEGTNTKVGTAALLDQAFAALDVASKLMFDLLPGGAAVTDERLQAVYTSLSSAMREIRDSKAGGQ